MDTQPFTDAKNRLRDCSNDIGTATDKLEWVGDKAASFIAAIHEGYLNQREVCDRLHEIAQAYDLYKEYGVDKVQAAMADGLDREEQRKDEQRHKANGSTKPESKLAQ